MKRVKIAFGVLFLALVGGMAYVSLKFKLELDKAALKIPKLNAIMEELSKQPTVILAADGTQLFQISIEYRKPVKIEDIPQNVLNATLAAEDKRFYQHGGVDPIAILRGLFVNLKEGGIAQGGSTLTMQLAKRLYSDSAKTYERKIQDMALAIQMESHLSKDQILELYLNQVYYGERAYGIAAAADVYYSKKLSQLTLGEAALLARLVRRPSQENPFADPKKALDNRDEVLRIMLEEKMISREEHDKAVKEKLRLRKKRNLTQVGIKAAPYFVDYVLDTIKRDLPGIDITTGGYRIDTTLDPKLQEIADQTVRRIVRENGSRMVRTAAFLLTDREGRILAMTGGVDYNRNQFNVITQGRRQPGSSFKPFIYAAAFENRDLSPGDTLSNAAFVWQDPNTGKVWRPKNSGGHVGGSVSVRTALTMSINLPAIRVMERVGPERAVQVCRDVFGFTSELDPVLPLVLGATAVSPMEMAEGYSVFMTGGSRFEPFGLRRVVGQDGKVVKDYPPQIAPNVLSVDTAQTMDELLRAVVTSGTATRAAGIPNARGKTGTTSDNRDAWFIGYTDKLLGVGWVANEIRNTSKSGPRWVYEPMRRDTFGGTTTIQIWTAVVAAAQNRLGEERRAVQQAPRTRRSSHRRAPDDVTEPAPEIPTDNTFPDQVSPIDEPGASDTGRPATRRKRRIPPGYADEDGVVQPPPRPPANQGNGTTG